MKEKTFFKILTMSIIIALAVIGLNTMSYASITEDTNTAKITVTNIEAGVEVNAYQLTTVNYDYTADQPKEVPYTWVEAVKTWVQTNYPNYVDPEKFHDAVTDNSAEAKEFYSKLSAAIKGGTVTLTATKTGTAEGTASYPVTAEKLTGKVEFTGCEMGTYLILIENGYMVYTPSVVNLTPSYDVANKVWNLAAEEGVTVKAKAPSVTKTVTDGTKDKDNYSTKDEISFTIVTDIPNYEEGSLAKNYYVSDKINGGLTIDKTSIAVHGLKGTADPVELTETDGDFTLTTESAQRPNNLGEATFVMNFAYEKIKAYDQIKIEYKATLSKSNITVEGSVGNSNTAYLDYSNNPYSATSYKTQESENKVYTYGAEISKIDKTTKAGLAGAEFELLSGDTKLSFVKTADGVYYQSEETGATTTLAVDSNGKLYIHGLDEGTYSLKETKAPEGYNISTTAGTITITDANLDGALDDEEGTTGIFKLDFPNSAGFQLPVTGGMGTTIFVASGIVVIGLGVMLLIVAVKKNKANK